MGTSGPSPSVTRDDTRCVFSQRDRPHAPLSTAEVADRLDCQKGTARQHLEALAEDGDIQSRRVDDQRRVWWLTPASGTDQPSDSPELGAFIEAVDDYAIFRLDPDGVVRSWNEGAARIKGYPEEEIVGEHFSTFYTDEDVEEGVPEQNLRAAAARGRLEDVGWRVRKDGSRFWANVTITAIRDEDGSLRGFTKVTRDMTEQREYEQQLREERDLTEQVLETVPVSVFVADTDGELVRANERVFERLGVDDSDLGGFGVDSWDIYDEEGDPISFDDWPWKRVIETGESVYGFECQVDVPEAGRRWLSVNAAALDDGQFDDERVVFAVDDITGRKERERDLRRESGQIEKLLRTAPIAIAVQDAAGNTVMANRHAQQTLGLSEREFIDDSTETVEWEIFDAQGELLEPSETPSARVLSTGEPVYDEEIVIEPPESERILFRVNAAPVFGPDGDIERVITTGEDITELKEREQQLEQRKDELETELSEILGRISDAFYALDEEWRFTHLNDSAAEIMQKPRAELLGRKVWDVFPDAEGNVFWEKFHAAMETQEPVNFEFLAEEFDTWLEFTVYPSKSGLSIYFRDISERREYERKLETSNERLEQFAYAASHDLQEPLRMVSSYLQLVERRYAGELDEDAREFIEFAVDGADRMRNMIDGLLEYSRVGTHGDPFESVDLNDVLADVCEDLQVRIEESGADIEAESLPEVDGDPGQLRQVFQNLLANAIEYSGDDPPRIDITASRDGGAWLISIRDEGIGIAPEDADRVFEVFQSLDSSTEHSGTGIGLALCERIVERHGGDIWVESELGAGATFSFTLPAIGTDSE